MSLQTNILQETYCQCPIISFVQFIRQKEHINAFIQIPILVTRNLHIQATIKNENMYTFEMSRFCVHLLEKSTNMEGKFYQTIHCWEKWQEFIHTSRSVLYQKLYTPQVHSRTF